MCTRAKSDIVADCLPGRRADTSSACWRKSATKKSETLRRCERDKRVKVVKHFGKWDRGESGPRPLLSLVALLGAGDFFILSPRRERKDDKRQSPRGEMF